MEGTTLRVLSLDLGERRIGVAVSDPTGTIVTPVKAIVRKDSEKRDVKAVSELVTLYGAGAIVIGLPITLNGRLGHAARLVQNFIAALSLESSVPIISQDERFSTVEAERLLHESGHVPSREKGLRDSASASVILQSYLDRQGN